MAKRIKHVHHDDSGQFIVKPLTGTQGLLTASDFSLLGIFGAPGDLDFGYGLTHRYVGGTLVLYSIAYPSGSLIEYAPVADGSLSATPGGASIATTRNNFGDIYQNAIYRRVADGFNSNAPPCQGVSLVGVPQGCYWDETDQRMYWTHIAIYASGGESFSDTCLGWSTLNDANHTGTGVAMVALATPGANGGNRWCFGMTPIPSGFSSQYVSGKRLGVGFGGVQSIIATGPCSIGPSLFAINPPLAADDRDYISNGITRLLNYPYDGNDNGVQRCNRPSSVYCNTYFSDNYAGPTKWTWSDGYEGGVRGYWINGPRKQGLFTLCQVAAGTMDSPIQASPTPTNLVFTVANVGDTVAGDVLRVPTDTTASDPQYPFCYGRVASVSGNQITMVKLINGHTGVDDTTGIPIVGQNAWAGTQYSGGGPFVSRWRTLYNIYDPADLARVAQGSADSWLVPAATGTFDFAGQTYPIQGGFPGDSVALIRGMTFDATTKRLYVYVKGLQAAAPGPWYQLIYVYSVNC